MSPILSIIIVSYNTKGLLDQCLRSIFKSPAAPQYEVIVVDNASSDGSVEMVAESYRTVRLIENRENAGFAGANNQGFQCALGRYALLLNSDTEVLGDALETMCQYMEANPEVGIVGAQLLNSDRSLQPSGNRIPSLWEEIRRLTPFRKRGNPHFDSQRDYYATVEVEEVSGACLMARRKVWEKIGLLDENFFFYFEDVDFCLRAGRAGWKVIYLPTAQILHHWGRSTNKQTDPVFAAKCLQGHIYWTRKRHGVLGEALLRTVVGALAGAKLIVGLLGACFGFSRGRELQKVNGRFLRVCVGSCQRPGVVRR